MEEELLMLKSNGLLSCEERQEEMKQMEVYRSHTKFMKNKVSIGWSELYHEANTEDYIHPSLFVFSFCSVSVIFLFPSLQCFFQMEQVKQDLSRKDTELLGLQTKLETLTNQFSDSKQHIEVLKESLTAKEQRAAILQTEVKEMHTCTLMPSQQWKHVK